MDLKNAELRLITLYEELLLLKEFEKRENNLTEGVAIKIAERQDSQKKVRKRTVYIQCGPKEKGSQTRKFGEDSN